MIHVNSIAFTIIFHTFKKNSPLLEGHIVPEPSLECLLKLHPPHRRFSLLGLVYRVHLGSAYELSYPLTHDTQSRLLQILSSGLYFNELTLIKHRMERVPFVNH